MHIVYQWTEPEWNDAVRLATERPHRPGSISGITYALVLVPLTGAALSGLLKLQQTGTLTMEGSILPLLLLMVALCGVFWMAGIAWSRRRRREYGDPMPTHPCEFILLEGGWCLCDPAIDVSSYDSRDPSFVEAANASGRRFGEQPPLLPWSSLTGTRQNDRVILLLHRGGFHGMPLRCLSEDQISHIQRMLSRKLRPSPERRSSVL